jgi:hypothetical protein
LPQHFGRKIYNPQLITAKTSFILETLRSSGKRIFLTSNFLPLEKVLEVLSSRAFMPEIETG